MKIAPLPGLIFFLSLFLMPAAAEAGVGFSLGSDLVLGSMSNAVGPSIAADFRFRSRIGESGWVWGFQAGPRYFFTKSTNGVSFFLTIPAEATFSYQFGKDLPVVLRPGLGLGAVASILTYKLTSFGVSPVVEPFFELGFKIGKEAELLLVPSLPLVMEFFSGGNLTPEFGIKLAFQFLK